MTRSLIRLDNTVRAILNDDCITNSHDECQWNDIIREIRDSECGDDNDDENKIDC